MASIKILLLFVCVQVLQWNSSESKLTEYIKWKQLDYKDLPRRDTANESYFIPYNNVPMSMMRYQNMLFVGVARRRPGIPSTLNFIDLNEPNFNLDPKLQGFPNYEINELHPELKADPNRIVSVYRMRVDRCDRLWFADTGMLEYPNNLIVVQRPSIWVIDLKTKQTLRRYEVPASVVDIGWGMTSVTLDVDDTDCNNAFVYIPDLQTYRIIVYSYAENRAWRFVHNYFFLNPLEGDFNIAGIKFAWDDGIFSIALSNKKPNGYKIAFFHALGSTSEFVVSTQVLRNETLAKRGYHGDDFRLLGNRGCDSQSGVHAFDKKSRIIFYAQVQKSAVSCWNTDTQFDRHLFDTVYQNATTMIYPNDMSIDSDGYLWVMANSIPKLIYSTIDVNEYNFRIWREKVEDAVKGTICDPSADKINQINFIAKC